MSAMGGQTPGESGHGLLFYAVVYLVFLYVPVLFLPVFSFNDGTIVAFPLKGFTLKWYGQLAEAGPLWNALKNSLVVACASATLSTVLGLLAARAFVRHRTAWQGASEGLVMLPLVVPGVIVATGMLVTFVNLGLPPSRLAVILGHTFLLVPFAVAILKSAFEQFDSSLEEAARDLGESAFGAFRRVTLPVVAPGLLASFLVTFTVSFDEFVLAFFLAGSEPTLPIYIWSQIRFPAKLPSTLALASVLLLASMVMLAAAEVLRRRGVGADGGTS